MHMENLVGSIDAPVFTPRRQVEEQMSFGAGQPEYNGPRMFAVKLLQDLEFLVCCPKVEGMGTRNIRTQMGMITLKDMCFKCDILMQGKRSSAFGRLMDSN